MLTLLSILHIFKRQIKQDKLLFPFLGKNWRCSARRRQFTPRGGWLESCRNLGSVPLGQPPGGQSGAGRPHDACQPREKLSRHRSPDELSTMILEPQNRRRTALNRFLNTLRRLLKARPFLGSENYHVLSTEEYKGFGGDITTPIGGGCIDK